MHKDKEEMQLHRREHASYEHAMPDGEMFLQALNGFLMILTCEGEVFFATHSIESYLGFHQSDIVHQSVYELVHSEDREELQRQLLWNSFLPAEASALALPDALSPDRAHLLERSFTVRFRCLLDNTSGFLRLDIRGRVKVLHGQNKKTEEPPLALFAICAPFGPPSLLEIPQKEVMFKSKHKLDLSLVSMDQRGKILLGYSDAELANMGGYDLVHYDDLAYVASAHQELLKTGASGMIAYRFQTKEGPWQWLQTSSRLVYKNSKPDFVISTHRPLMEEEGRDLLGKRTMDFKVSYLDTGLTNLYFSENDQLLGGDANTNSSCGSVSAPPQRVNRRYKTQLRDFLSTCRSKRKLAAGSPAPPPAPPPPVDYAAAAYTNLNNVYVAPYPPAPDNSLAYAVAHSPNLQHSLYPVDNRFLTTDNIFHQYKPLGAYYHHPSASSPYVTNGFLDAGTRAGACSLPAYDTSGGHHGYQLPNKYPDDKLYACHREPSPGKYYPLSHAPYAVSPDADVTSRNDSPATEPYPIEEAKVEEAKEPARQTVLMWGPHGEVPGPSPPPPIRECKWGAPGEGSPEYGRRPYILGSPPLPPGPPQVWLPPPGPFHHHTHSHTHTASATQ